MGWISNRIWARILCSLRNSLDAGVLDETLLDAPVGNLHGSTWQKLGVRPRLNSQLAITFQSLKLICEKNVPNIFYMQKVDTVIKEKGYSPQPHHQINIVQRMFLTCLASSTSGQDALSLLGVSAAVVDVGIRETSSPHHDTTELVILSVFADNLGQSSRLKVVLSTRLSTSSTERRSRDTNEDLSISRGASGNVGLPLVEVDGAIGAAAGVVVELDKEIVELSLGDDLVHVRLGDGALRSTSDEVLVGGVGGKVGAKLGNHELVVLVARVGFNVEIPAVDEGLAEGTGHGAVGGRVAVGVPQVLADGLGFLLGSQGVSARSAAEGHDDLDAVGLAGLNGRGETVAVLGLAAGADGAGLADGAGGDRDAVAVLVKEGKDNHVNAGFLGAVSSEVVVLDNTATVLAPVDDVLSSGGGAGSKDAGSGHGCAGEEEARESGEGRHLDM